MAGVNITWNDGGIGKKLRNLGDRSGKIVDEAIRDCADMALLMSVGGLGFGSQVPHDEGILQASGVNEPVGLAHYRVGYHTKYAAYLHEHPELRFQKGRKGKYLEDPILNNQTSLANAFFKTVKAGIAGV